MNGFCISSAGRQAAIKNRYIVSEKLSFSLELKIKAICAEIPIAGVTAIVQNYAAHGLIGIGYDF